MSNFARHFSPAKRVLANLYLQPPWAAGADLNNKISGPASFESRHTQTHRAAWFVIYASRKGGDNGVFLYENFASRSRLFTF